MSHLNPAPPALVGLTWTSSGPTTAVASGLVLAGVAFLVPLRAEADPPGLPAEDPPSDTTRIVLLGTTHFAGSSTDRHGSGVGGILSDRRQRELEAVAERIAAWGTDRFFVECSPDEQAAFDADYQEYRSGSYDLAEPESREGRGEIHQLGFRVADAAGLDGVDCADAEVFVPGSRARGVAAEHNPELLESYRRYAERPIARDSLLANRTLREFLVALNADSLLWRNHRGYIQYYARMGSFRGAGEKIRRESELAGSTFAAPFDVAERHMNELREFIESIDGQLVDDPGPDTDYVVLLDRRAAAAEAGPGTGADTVSVRQLSSMVERTSTTWVGFPDHHIGADMVAQWYKRNLRIYANVAHRVGDADRVVLMMGQAHVWTLRQFFRDSPDFEVVPLEDVL